MSEVAQHERTIKLTKSTKLQKAIAMH